jgi:hypothetical protein
MPEDYKARPEQVILFTVSAWDANCAQHIPQRFEVPDVAAALAHRDARIAALEAKIKRLRDAPGPQAQNPTRTHSIDDFVRDRKKARRDFDTKRFGGLQVDDKLDFGG